MVVTAKMNKGFLGLALIPLIVAALGGVTLVGFFSGWVIQAVTVIVLGAVGYILLSKGVETYQIVPEGQIHWLLIGGGLMCFVLMIHMISPSLFEDIGGFQIAGDVPATAQPLNVQPLAMTSIAESPFGGIPWWGLGIISFMIIVGLYYLVTGERTRQKITRLTIRRI